MAGVTKRITRLRRSCGDIKRRLWAALLSWIPGSSATFGPPRRFSCAAAIPVVPRDGTGNCRNRRIEVCGPGKSAACSSAVCAAGGPQWKFQNAGTGVELLASHVVVLSDARLLGPDPAVVGEGDQLFGDLSTYAFPLIQEVFYRWRNPRPVRVEAPVVLLAAPAKNNIAHWVGHSMERLWLFDQVPVNQRPRDCLYAVDRKLMPYMDSCLDVFRIPPNRRLEVSRDTHWDCSELWVPVHRQNGNFEPAFVQWLRGGVSNLVKEGPSRRIYVSRGEARFRRVVNEGELVPLLQSRSFDIVRLELLTFEEQVNLFANAEVVIAPHGAGLVNLAFCKPGTRVLELFSPDYVNVTFQSLATAAALNSFYLIGDGPQPTDFGDYYGSWRIESDIRCDPKVFTQALERVMAAGDRGDVAARKMIEE